MAFFQYFYKEKSKSTINIVLFTLKTIGLFLLILLLINPTIKTIELKNVKPILSVVIDNSKSISFFNEENKTNEIISLIEKNIELNEKFDIRKFSFSNTLYNADSINYNGSETNIYKAITSVNEINKEQIAPVILLTDGNQTIGNDYEYLKSNQPIYPIVLGDTTNYEDLNINRLNVNKYSYIKNKFPVEVLINYDGNRNINSVFTIKQRGRTIFSEKVKFSPQKKSKIILANLTSNKEGVQYYTASIKKLENEKNSKNNIKNFSVEVIDEQTKVLIVASVLHPDIGVLKKAIESNKQRKVEIVLINNIKKQLNDYQLVIFYQPNNKFNLIFDALKKEKFNYLLITGESTNWDFVNKQLLGFRKNAINQVENFTSVYNPNFLTFLQKNIGFNHFPPLKDNFGEVTFSKEFQPLLFQKINGIETDTPLLSTFEENNQKSALLLGEGIWKWRAASYMKTNSFQDFDEFIGNLVQYLASNKKRNRLEVSAESLYAANSIINISAFYTDNNYKFDKRATLEILITNTDTKENLKLPFSLVNNSYQTEIENLPSGNYTYKVSVNGQNINKYGRFKITNYQIEEQFTNANYVKLNKLALNTNGKIFYKNETSDLIKELLENKKYYITQKSKTKEQNLIDWKWILAIVITLFTIEWFVRKYYGKI